MFSDMTVRLRYMSQGPINNDLLNRIFVKIIKKVSSSHSTSPNGDHLKMSYQRKITIRLLPEEQAGPEVIYKTVFMPNYDVHELSMACKN